MNQQSEFLKNLGISELNEMQKEVLEAYKPSGDLVLYSPTGSGKTVAFLLSILKSLDTDSNEIQVIIIAPVRELAIQIDSVFRKMATGNRIACVYGGHSIREESRSLEVTPAILVGTPGRILDLIHRKIIYVRKVHTLVLDEFDKSLELGFENEMSGIAERLHNLQSQILTSATELRSYPNFLSLKDPATVNFLSRSEALKTDYFVVPSKDTDKMETAFLLACSFKDETSIFFCNHRDAVDRLSVYFNNRNLVHAVFHGGLEQDDREKALIRFRNGTCPVFVSTDLAARGLDITDVGHVVHFQLPLDEKSMTHRNGRTARAGKSGNVHFILNEKEYLPEYLTIKPIENNVDSRNNVPLEPKWETLFFDLGKKDKVNKIDLVGFLCQTGKLDKSEIGLISVTDRRSFVAVKKAKAKSVLASAQGQKIKKKQVRIRIAD
ncbi:MAG: DEAD/DEAH box helicase [Crocinitomicaceae bacterium]|nr:DEAD/DEAH box helicase [Crocinitomicaceae bacterium]